jgi:two-component system response regulator FixJ
MNNQLQTSPSPLVMIVDDDLAVRNSLKFSLEVEGFAVRVFAAGDDLLTERELPAAGCLVIDQNMPGMNGLDVVATLRARDIRVPAILITGHPTAALNASAARVGVPVIEKPLLGSALLDRIRDALAGGTDARPN